MKRAILALTALAALGGCGVFSGGDKKVTPTVGTRIPVLAAETGIEVDPALANVAITLPGAAANPDWAQPGGNASKAMGHVALGASPSQAWSVSIGAGSDTRVRLGSGPVIADGRVYTIDTQAMVRAFDAATGRMIWERGVGAPADRRGGRSLWDGELTGARGLLFGGGVSFFNGRVYATSGIGDVQAMDAATGAEVWRVRPGGPLRGAPTIANDAAYVTSQDNQLFALNLSDGKVIWTAAGTLEAAGVFGTAAPAAAQGTVVAGFSSGELTAYRYENGRVVWQDALSRTSISTTVASLSDIDAEPVIDQGRVYAVGQGGRMVALELVTGQRIWEINIAGLATPWVAGEWIFVVTDQAQLLAIARSSGRVKWMSQLPRFRNEEKKSGPIIWFGPVLAGERLILVNTRGQMAYVSPYDGSIQSTVDVKDSLSLPPVVAGGTMYLLHDNGRLTAWR